MAAGELLLSQEYERRLRPTLGWAGKTTDDDDVEVCEQSHIAVN